MKQQLRAAIEQFQTGRYAEIVESAEGTALAEMHPLMAAVVGRALGELGDDDRASEYLLDSFIREGHPKTLTALCGALRKMPHSDRLRILTRHVLEHHHDKTDYLANIAPLIEDWTHPSEVAPEDSLIAFHSFTERGLTDAAIEMGRRLIAAGAASDAVRVRLRELLLSRGHTAEALGLPVPTTGVTVTEAALKPLIIGSSREGLQIIGLCEVTALGDFACRLLILCKLKQNNPRSHVTFCYVNDRPFKRDMVKFAGILDECVEVDAPTVEGAVKALGALRVSRSIIVNSESYPLKPVGRTFGAPLFQTPDTLDASLISELSGAGVDPDRWFAVMHYRQGVTAPFSKSDPYRDVQAANFHATAEHIISQGGQVVRLGHAGMDRLPERQGYIDLSSASVALQMYATERARFMVGTDSGMVMFGIGFATPTGRTNVVYEINQENPGDINLLRNIVSTEGYALSTEHLYSGGTSIALIRFPTSDSYVMFENTPAQLKAVADRLLSRTMDIGAWRPKRATAGAVIDGAPFPMDWVRVCEVCDLSDLLGLPVKRFAA